MFKNSSKPFLYFIYFIINSFIIGAVFILLPLMLILQYFNILALYVLPIYYFLFVTATIVWEMIDRKKLNKIGISVPNFGFSYLPILGFIVYLTMRTVAKIESKKLVNQSEIKL